MRKSISIEFIAFLFSVIGECFVLVVIATIPVWYVWNKLMPILFGLDDITITQSFLLNVLCFFLFRLPGLLTGTSANASLSGIENNSEDILREIESLKVDIELIRDELNK